ncbi:hypothetical protein CCMSSC00406_0009682 [Pleurotus cornucopiae]|uniref:Uncharacterized protein n=1 Tax=Pleurotus cornucopiae TaxID=5321 RepID=A0ACB7IZ80_PLECO|nr:hypothetical protein CCMSSC00406_0009682 [Pleurotus cornucopiae]
MEPRAQATPPTPLARVHIQVSPQGIPRRPRSQRTHFSNAHIHDNNTNNHTNKTQMRNNKTDVHTNTKEGFQAKMQAHLPRLLRRPTRPLPARAQAQAQGTSHPPARPQPPSSLSEKAPVPEKVPARPGPALVDARVRVLAPAYRGVPARPRTPLFLPSKSSAPTTPTFSLTPAPAPRESAPAVSLDGADILSCARRESRGEEGVTFAAAPLWRKIPGHDGVGMEMAGEGFARGFWERPSVGSKKERQTGKGKGREKDFGVQGSVPLRDLPHSSQSRTLKVLHLDLDSELTSDDVIPCHFPALKRLHFGPSSTPIFQPIEVANLLSRILPPHCEISLDQSAEIDCEKFKQVQTWLPILIKARMEGRATVTELIKVEEPATFTL